MSISRRKSGAPFVVRFPDGRVKEAMEVEINGPVKLLLTGEHRDIEMSTSAPVWLTTPEELCIVCGLPNKDYHVHA